MRDGNAGQRKTLIRMTCVSGPFVFITDLQSVLNIKKEEKERHL